VNSIEDARKYLSRVERQAFDCVAVVKHKIADMKVGYRLAEDGLLVRDRACAVGVRYRLTREALYERLPGYVHRCFARENPMSIRVASAEAARELQGHSGCGCQVPIARKAIEALCCGCIAGLTCKSRRGDQAQNCEEERESFHVVPLVVE
jgi:hypothetical protein